MSEICAVTGASEFHTGWAPDDLELKLVYYRIKIQLENFSYRACLEEL